MQTQLLVVSDPPHRDVDYEAAAELLGLDVRTTRLKLGFPAPEVLAVTDPAPATETATGLHEAGVSVTVIDGRELVELPWGRVVSSYAFGESALEVRLSDGPLAIPYESEATAVYWKPPPDFTAPTPAAPEIHPLTGADLAEAIQFQAGVDLFFPREGALERLSIVRGVATCSGPEGLAGASPTEAIELVVAELVRRFPHADVDTRLENVRPRRRFTMGDESFDLDMRKLFSYGTLLLRQALMAVSPELGDLPQYELGSRVAYVLARARTAAQQSR